MKDQLLKALAFEGQVRVVILDGKNMVQEAQERHETLLNATAALGRTLMGTTLLASNLKNDETLTTRLKGNGPLGGIVAVSDGDGRTKGYVQNPQVRLQPKENGAIDVSGAVGTEGFLNITKDLHMKDPYSGEVPLVSGEIAEDFTYYAAVSEQTPSSFGLSVLINPDETVKSAGGFMIQIMPGIEEETIAIIEKRLAELGPLSEIFSEEKNLENVLQLLVGENSYKIVEETEVGFVCDCSKGKFAEGMASLGNHELNQMIAEDQGAEVQCHFCNEKYHYTAQELEELKS